MAFDYGLPAIGNDALIDIEQIRENFLKLLNCHKGSSEPSIDPTHSHGMLWLYTPATGNWILRQRNKDNNGWINLWELTATGVPSAHFALSTATTTVHGARQGSGNGFDADKLDGKHYSDLFHGGQVAGSYVDNTGTDVFIGSDTERTVQGTTPHKLKEIVLHKVPDTTLKIFFSTHKIYGEYNGGIQVYRNGVGVGTIHTIPDSYTNYTDIISGWSDGDLLQLYAWSGDVDGTVYAKDFRILCKKSYAINL